MKPIARNVFLVAGLIAAFVLGGCLSANDQNLPLGPQSARMAKGDDDGPQEPKGSGVSTDYCGENGEKLTLEADDIGDTSGTFDWTGSDGSTMSGTWSQTNSGRVELTSTTGDGSGTLTDSSEPGSDYDYTVFPDGAPDGDSGQQGTLGGCD